MRAVVVRGHGGPETLEVVDVPVPQPAQGQVRVRVEAAGVNPVDAFVRSGGMQAAGLDEPRETTGLGVDLAGVVDELGPGVAPASGLRPGDRVIGLSLRLTEELGTYAEYAVLDADAVVPAPRTATAAEGATLPLCGLTAWQALDELGRLGLPEGGTVLVTGAAGAVGGFATQLAALRGLRVVGHARAGDEELVRGLGAEFFVPDTVDLAQAVRELVPGGVDGAVDAAVVVGPAHDAVRDGGAFIPVVMHGVPDEARGIAVTLLWARADRTQLAELSRLVDEGRLTLRVGETFSLQDAVAAHERLDAGGTRGKLVIVP